MKAAAARLLPAQFQTKGLCKPRRNGGSLPNEEEDYHLRIATTSTAASFLPFAIPYASVEGDRYAEERPKNAEMWPGVCGSVQPISRRSSSSSSSLSRAYSFLCLASFRLEPISHSALTVLTLREARKSRRPYLIHVMVVSGHIWSCLVVSGSIWCLVDLILELAFLF